MNPSFRAFGPRVSNWTDAHCHLQDRFLGEGEIAISASEALKRARAAGVDRVVVIGTDAISSAEALALTDLSGDVDIYARSVCTLTTRHTTWTRSSPSRARVIRA